MEERNVPIWERYALSVEDAAAYFGIGENRLRRIIAEQPNAPYLFWIGSHVRIKRQAFEKYVDGLEAI